MQQPRLAGSRGQSSPRRVMSLPVTSQGRRSSLLIAASIISLIILNLLGSEGSMRALRLLFWALFEVCGVGAFVLALLAVLQQRERSVVTGFTLLLGAFAVVAIPFELLTTH